MSEQSIVLDLGEFGSILIEPLISTPPPAESAAPGVVQAGLGDTIQEAGQKVTANAQALLQRSLAGLGNMFLTALPPLRDNDEFQLDEFSVEFEVGLTTEAGLGTGVVAKLMPEGHFRCTYTWQRKPGSPK